MEENKSLIIKNLFIKKEQCTARLVKIYKDDKEVTEQLTLEAMGMHRGQHHQLVVRLIRRMAFLSDQDVNDMVAAVDARTQERYPLELILQAINMAPECTFDQTLSNLVNNAVRVFERILQAECRQILSEVKAIRE